MKKTGTKRKKINDGETGYGQGTPYKEAMKAESKEPKAGRGGKMWAEKWVNLGRSGQEVGKRTDFARLGPDNSTQVVDFPHLGLVRVFWGAMKS
jgi:hypothetical protein